MLDIVVTTISDGTFLREWGKLIRQAGRHDHARMVVIPDVNTPRTLYDQVEKLRADGIMAVCPTPDEQEEFLAKLDCRNGFIPWRSDNRRNVGYLMALADGADALVSVDDDNMPLTETWFGVHEVVTDPAASYAGVGSASGWYSSMDMIASRPTGSYWPRGFPYFARHGGPIWDTTEEVEVAVNMGVWVGDPDVDAITRIGAGPVSWAQQRSSVVLSPGTWMPVNSQNTAIRREAIPAYWFARMGHEVNGLQTGRWGDIFSGYFVQACAKHLGHGVRVGTPLVKQDRNVHDLFADLEMEYPLYRVNERLAGWLPSAGLEGSTYRDAYESLSYGIHDLAEDMHTDSEKGFLHRMAYHMRYWLKLTDQIGGV